MGYPSMSILSLFISFMISAATFSSPVTGSKSDDPDTAVFTLSNIEYTESMVYSTPAHLAVADGHITFNLSNTAVPYITYCEAYGYHLTQYFYGEFTYNCDSLTGVEAGAGSNFTFSRPDGVLNVNQTWMNSQSYVSSLQNECWPHQSC